MSRSHDPVSERHVHEIQQHVAQQEALVHRMIMQGTPTQEAEDRLRQLKQTLAGMKDQHRHHRASAVQRTVRLHRSP